MLFNEQIKLSYINGLTNEREKKDVILVFKCNLGKVDTRKRLYKKVSSVGKVLCLTKDNNYLVNFVKFLKLRK